MYHLAIFYFVSAYFYNEEKYGEDPAKHFGNRVKANWLKYIFYSIILVLLHNTFVKYHFISPKTKLYNSPRKLLPALLNTLTFSCPELFAGAMWFLPTLIFAITMFGIIVYFARKISNIGQDEKEKRTIKYIIIIAFSIMCGMLGVYLNTEKLKLSYNMHTSFLVLPICAFGYFVKEYKNIIKTIKKNYVAIITAIVTAAIIIYVAVKKGYFIGLAEQKIISGHMFYIMSFIGILFCLSLAAIIEKVPILNKLIALCGKHSFAIMALHYAAAKFVDVIYSKVINETNPEVISRWVTSYPQKLWIIYLIVGCVLPLIISTIAEQIKTMKIIMRKSQPKRLDEPKEEICQS